MINQIKYYELMNYYRIHKTLITNNNYIGTLKILLFIIKCYIIHILDSSIQIIF